MMGMFGEALSVGISLCLLLVFYTLWRDYWVDEVRDDLFALRDDMFVFAFENKLLDDPSYRLLRDLMNSVIRYSHEISAGRFAMLAIVRIFARPAEPQQFVEWRESVARLPQLQREKINAFHTSMAFLMGRQVFKTSMLLRGIALLFGIFFWFVRGNAADGKKELTGIMRLDLLEQDALAAAHA
jgi:hypothetical protein